MNALSDLPVKCAALVSFSETSYLTSDVETGEPTENQPPNRPRRVATSSTRLEPSTFGANALYRKRKRPILPFINLRGDVTLIGEPLVSSEIVRNVGILSVLGNNFRNGRQL